MRRALLLVLLAALLGGCGLGAGEKTSGVELTVTRDFGQDRVGDVREDAVAGGETVMRLLQRSFDVETRYGGGFVDAIEGMAGGRRRGRPVDWFYYVNGMEAGVGAAAFKLSAGDRVWWDYHDWGTAMRIPAVVGAFPEPFLAGIEGKRLPVRLDCAAGADRTCDEVTERLGDAGITRVARGSLRASGGPEVIRVLVGPWRALRGDARVRQLESSPRTSGVFARFAAEGARLELFDKTGRVARSLGPGAGLVAAVRYADEAPTWIVSGTDAAGADAAAAALAEQTLRRRFAVAVEEGRGISLPVRPAGAAP